MDRIMTRVSPTKSPIKEFSKNEDLASVLGLKCPTLIPQSPKMQSPVKPKNPPKLGFAIGEEGESPTKLPKSKDPEEERNRLQLQYVVDTSSLRDDFYSNLLAANPVADEIAIGLGSEVRLWSDQTGVSTPWLPHDWGTVVCLDYSESGILAIGYSGGRICLYDPKIEVKVSQVKLGATGYPTSIKFKGSDVIYVGDSKGHIYVIGYTMLSGRRKLRVNKQVVASKDIICGLCFNRSKTILVTGANDGYLSIWKTKSQDEYCLQLTARIRHRAAVKAISFFPTLPNLMVTGGGRADRTLTVRDIHSRERQYRVKLPAQVTSLVWLGKFDLFVGLGRTKGEKTRLGQVYRFEDGKCKYLFDVEATDASTRTVYGVKTTKGVCIGTKTKKLFFFEWKGRQYEMAKGIDRKLLYSPLR